MLPLKLTHSLFYALPNRIVETPYLMGMCLLTCPLNQPGENEGLLI